jgi:hypothetical protein
VFGVYGGAREAGMPGSRRASAWGLAAFLASAHLACVGACDIIGDTRNLPGGYYLERWQEGDHYTLGGPGHSSDAGGILVGSIEEIGWNEKYIVAWRNPMLGNERAGWMIVDLRSHAVRGPLTDAQLSGEATEDDALRTIRPLPPADYWGVARRRTRG